MLIVHSNKQTNKQTNKQISVVHSSITCESSHVVQKPEAHMIWGVISWQWNNYKHTSNKSQWWPHHSSLAENECMIKIVTQSYSSRDQAGRMKIRLYTSCCTPCISCQEGRLRTERKELLFLTAPQMMLQQLAKPRKHPQMGWQIIGKHHQAAGRGYLTCSCGYWRT